MTRPHDILETCLCVDDLAAAEAFYRGLLGLEFVSRQEERHVFLRLGRRMFLLFRAEASRQPGEIPPHGTTGAGHVAFACRDDEIEAWRERLESAGVAIETLYVWPNGARSLYFRDPAGNCLELASPRIWGMAEAPAAEGD